MRKLNQEINVENFVVFSTNAVVDPWTMMVKTVNAPIAKETVPTPWGLKYTTKWAYFLHGVSSKQCIVMVNIKAIRIVRVFSHPLQQSWILAGQKGVERALNLMRNEIERGMMLMGCRSVSELTRKNLKFR